MNFTVSQNKKGVLFDLFLRGLFIHVQRTAKLRDLGIEGDRRLAKLRAVKKLPCGVRFACPGQCSAVSDTQTGETCMHRIWKEKMSHVFCPIQTKEQMSYKHVPAEMSRFL